MLFLSEEDVVMKWLPRRRAELTQIQISETLK
jgi:hypothetical protein